MSFEIAQKRLSADTVNFSSSTSALSKGESLLDTALNIQAMHPDILIIRHFQSGAPYQISKHVKAHVINAGDGMHEHPTQALLDLMTIQETKGCLSGLKVGICGDIAHSRVARSDMLLFKKMGLDVTLIAPPTLIPPHVNRYGVDVTYSLDDVIKDLDVLMLLRIQKERAAQFMIPNLREYAIHFGVGMNKLKNAKEGLTIMHPGPVNRGIELSPEVADSSRSVILNQVTNGVSIRMAIMYLLLSDEKEESLP